MLSQGEFVIAIDHDDSRQKDFMLKGPNMKEHSSDLSDFTEGGADDFNRVLAGLVNKPPPHVVYTTERGAIGIDFKF